MITEKNQTGHLFDASEPWELILFVAGSGLSTLQTRNRLEQIWEKSLPMGHRMEVVDILEDRERAMAFDVIVTPTLIRLSPKPMRRVFGNLSLKEKILSAFEITTDQQVEATEERRTRSA